MRLRRMSTTAKLAEIRPEIKGLIDNAIVPILVREYLQELRNERLVAVARSGGALVSVAANA